MQNNRKKFAKSEAPSLAICRLVVRTIETRKEWEEMQKNHLSRILTVPELAKRLKICPRVARRLLTLGQLPGKKIGHQWRTAEGDLAAYLKGEHVAH
jgi:helix-turn-helix protein